MIGLRRVARHFRRLGPAVLSGFLSLTVVACDAAFVAPADLQPRVSFSISQQSLPNGELGVVDRVRVQLATEDGILLDSLFVLGANRTDFLLPVSFRRQVETATLRLELLEDYRPVLRGSTTLALRQREVTDAEVPLFPVDAPPLAPVSWVDAGLFHTCATADDVAPFCWGLNDSGQLGHDGFAWQPLPVTVTSLQNDYSSVESGYVSTCGLATDGRIFCWGSNERGSLGTGDGVDHPVPTAVNTPVRFSSLTVGGLHACGLSPDGGAYCWGFNGFGQLGDGSTTDRTTPVPVASQIAFQQLSAGYLHTCGVTFEGQVYCWGLNEFGQLGDGSSTDRLTPVLIPGIARIFAVSAGGLHTCALGGTETYCWGSNLFGQLGIGSTTNESAPVSLGNLSVNEISAGGLHTCALTEEGGASCWGYNGSGGVGDGTLVNRSTATPVIGMSNFLNISAGLHHTCGVTFQKVAVCWGYNRFGQLGNGSNRSRAEPGQVLFIEPFFQAGPARAAELRRAVDRLLNGEVRP